MDSLNQKQTKPQQEFFNDHPELVEKARRYPWDVFGKIYLDKAQLVGTKKESGEEHLKKAPSGMRLSAALIIEGTNHQFNPIRTTTYGRS